MSFPFSSEASCHEIQNRTIDNLNSKIRDEADVIYIRENPDGLTTYELGEMFGLAQQAISDIQIGKTYKNCGGTIRKPKILKRSPNVSEEQRKEIRRLRGQGMKVAALAEMFGFGKSTVEKIIYAK